MQRTIRADRAAVAAAVLVVDIEEECGLRDAQMPAPAAPDTTNSEIADIRLVGSMAEGVVVSGYGV